MPSTRCCVRCILYTKGIRKDREVCFDRAIPFQQRSIPVRQRNRQKKTVLTQTLGLTFIGTDPVHERRGAASLLLQWGLVRCVRDNVPAYLESTVDAGPLYERHGFTSAENLSMVLEGREGESALYEEVCFIFRPGATPFTMDPRIQSAI